MLSRGDQQGCRSCAASAPQRHPHAEVVHVTARASDDAVPGRRTTPRPQQSTRPIPRRSGTRTPHTRGPRRARSRTSRRGRGPSRSCRARPRRPRLRTDLPFKRSHVVVDAVDLVSVHAHEALLGELRAERAVRVRRRNDLGVRDLRAVLRNTHRPGDVRHRLLHAVGARAERQKHLPEPQHNLGLMGEAVVRRHTLGEDLVLPTVVGGARAG